MAAPLGAAARPGSKRAGLGRRRLLIAAALAAVLVIYLRRKSGSDAITFAPAAPTADGLAGGNGLDALSNDVAHLASVLEDQTGALADLTLRQTELEVTAEDAAVSSFLATQWINDLSERYAELVASGGTVAGGGTGAGDPTPTRTNPAPSPVPAPLVQHQGWAEELGIVSGYSPGVAGVDLAAALFDPTFGGALNPSTGAAYITTAAFLETPSPLPATVPPLPGPASPAPAPPPLPIAYYDQPENAGPEPVRTLEFMQATGVVGTAERGHREQEI